jgi:hypothetical protein
MLSVPFAARGVALTDSVCFTDREGGQWLVYVEALPAPRGTGFWHRTRMPGRALRFDSADESRASPTRPAGAPYLSDQQLQDLLDQAQPMTDPFYGKPLDALRSTPRPAGPRRS